MEKHTGCVDDALQTRHRQDPESPAGTRCRVGRGSRLQRNASLLERLPGDRDEQRAGQVEVTGEVAGQRIDGREIARVHVGRLPAPVSSTP